MQNLKITFIQSHLAWQDHQANIQAFEEKITQINTSPDLIILPEMFNTGFVVKPKEIDPIAAKESLLWLQRMAVLKQSVISASMIVEEDEQYYNRLFWVRPDGSYSTYDKKHLFSLGNEHLRFTAGSDQLIVELKGWKIKPLICYDLRFPIWAKNNYDSGNYDYDLLIYVANWPAARAYAWRSLLTARAIENQAYAIGVNRIGKDDHGTPHSGFSGVIDPKGEWISAEAIDMESVQTISLSAKDLIDYRTKFTVGLDWDEFEIK
ncbi:MAG: amidohydrolase [Bacteroidales bacterium]|nr:amidohydrolase [Bacteroidales bacterium]